MTIRFIAGLHSSADILQVYQKGRLAQIILTLRSIAWIGAFRRHRRATKSPGLMSMSKMTGFPLI
jgi:hypothetical protein